MVSRPEVLAIVPARGGSKSIPRKNIRPLGGHPLVAYSIAAGLQAASVNRVIVSTDDEEIAEVGRRYGAETPFLRPAEIAADETPDLPVFEHALAWLSEHERYVPDIVVQLRPTSPLRPKDCVDRAVTALWNSENADSVRGVIPSGQNPFKMWRIESEGWLSPLLTDGFDEPFNMPRQTLPPTYWQTGHIDAIRCETILEKASMTGNRILPLVLESRFAVDVDSQLDWLWAEWLLEAGELGVILPDRHKRTLPEEVRLVVLDFDGVLTDNRVWVDEDGLEQVAAHRGDGWGLARLKDHGVQIVVLSTERNPVVAARCEKLGVEALQGIDHKGAALTSLLEEREIPAEYTVYVGNDVNDLECFPIVACAVVVADAHPEALAAADVVLRMRGGHGAVREISDRILRRDETHD